MRCSKMFSLSAAFSVEMPRMDGATPTLARLLTHHSTNSMTMHRAASRREGEGVNCRHCPHRRNRPTAVDLFPIQTLSIGRFSSTKVYFGTDRHKIGGVGRTSEEGHGSICWSSLVDGIVHKQARLYSIRLLGYGINRVPTNGEC